MEGRKEIRGEKGNRTINEGEGGQREGEGKVKV